MINHTYTQLFRTFIVRELGKLLNCCNSKISIRKLRVNTNYYYFKHYVYNNNKPWHFFQFGQWAHPRSRPRIATSPFCRLPSQSPSRLPTSPLHHPISRAPHAFPVVRLHLLLRPCHPLPSASPLHSLTHIYPPTRPPRASHSRRLVTRCAPSPPHWLRFKC